MNAKWSRRFEEVDRADVERHGRGLHAVARSNGCRPRSAIADWFLLGLKQHGWESRPFFDAVRDSRLGRPFAVRIPPAAGPLSRRSADPAVGQPDEAVRVIADRNAAGLAGYRSRSPAASSNR
jgi:hypothetical protein